MTKLNSCEAPIDPNFVETIKLLNNNNVSYWVCNGTLLGLIRDKQLIPWDHDIDIAIFRKDISKTTIMNLMMSNGYKIKDQGFELDYITFSKRGGRDVDFNFYNLLPKSNLVYAHVANFPRRNLTSILDTIAKLKTYKGKSVYIEKLLYYSLNFFQNTLVKLLKKSGKYFVAVAYTTPANLLIQFDYIEISGIKIRMPSKYGSFLEYTYGSDWKVPNKDFSWSADSPSSIFSKSRFR